MGLHTRAARVLAAALAARAIAELEGGPDGCVEPELAGVSPVLLLQKPNASLQQASQSPEGEASRQPEGAAISSGDASEVHKMAHSHRWHHARHSSLTAHGQQPLSSLQAHGTSSTQDAASVFWGILVGIGLCLLVLFVHNNFSWQKTVQETTGIFTDAKGNTEDKYAEWKDQQPDRPEGVFTEGQARKPVCC
jgi:hypothetical protein